MDENEPSSRQLVSGLAAWSLASGEDSHDEDDPELDALLAETLDTSLEELDEYKLTRLLGEGAMGKVFLARDRLLDREVAIKLITHRDRFSHERFRVEARAAARIQHANIISIYRIGQVGDTPYIVSEYVRGQTLSRVARPIPWQHVLALAIPLLRGLAAAHRRGVLHRDIKPDNVIVSRAGEPKLGDFGLAKLLDLADGEGAPGSSPAEETTDPGWRDSTRASGPVGTPYYMAPEIWQGEPATARSDLYSLGALLYELCAGAVPHRGVLVRDLQRVVATSDAPPLGSRAPHVEPHLAAIIDRCLARVPDERFASAEALLDALIALDTASKSPSLPEGSPYRGLLPFDDEHRALFFGRDVAIREVTERLRTASLVLVAGQSGVGKSSLIRAGVLPRIREAGLGDGRVWTSVTVVPGAHPLTVLGSMLALHAELDAADEAALVRGLRSDVAAVSRRLRTHLGQESGLVIFIDQLEELVTLSEPGQARAVSVALAGLLERTPSARFVATVRGDKLVDLAQLPGLGSLIERSLYILRPLGEDEIRQAVVGPARALGVRFESEALVTRLVRPTVESTGGLPLLQFALSELWDARDQEQKCIPDRALEKLGGVAGALSRHADSVVDRLLPATRDAARRLMIRLVTWHGTRARHGEAELVGGDDTRQVALRALIEGRLVVVRQIEGETTCEIAHEALVKNWSTLRQWLEQEGNRRVVRERLAATAQEWHRMDRGSDALWRGRPLLEATDLDRRDLTAIERAFIDASVRDEAQRRRIRRGLGGAAIVILVMVLAVVLYLARQADHQRDRAEAFARESRQRMLELYIGQSRQKILDGDPRQALILLTEARKAGASDPATDAMIAHAIDRMSGELLVLPGHEGALYDGVISPDSRYIATASADHTARLWDASTGQLLHTFHHDKEVWTVAFHPDSSQLATAGWDSVVKVWSTATGQLLWSGRHDGALLWVGYDHRGTRLATTGRDSTARIWDARTGKALALFDGHTRAVTSAAFSADDDLLVTSSSDGTARVWSTDTGKLVTTLSGDGAPLIRVVMSPGGHRAVLFGESHIARVIALAGGPAVALAGHGAQIEAASFSPDGTRVVTASEDRSARVWDVEAGKLLLELSEHAGGVTDASFSPDGRTIVTASRDGNIRLWSAETGFLEWVFVGHDTDVWRARYDARGERIVSATFDGTARVWNAQQRASALAVDGHGSVLGSATFSPDGARIATAESSGAVRVWRRDGDLVLSLQAGQNKARVAWSPDGTRLLSSQGREWADVQGKKDASLWDAHSGRLVGTIHADGGQIFHAVYDPGGQRIVTAEVDGATLRDADSGEPLVRLRGHRAEVWFASFDPRGERVGTASKDTTARIWDAMTGELLHTLQGHTLDVNTARFSRDGAHIITASYDNTAKIWTSSGQLVVTLEGHVDSVYDATFSADSALAVTVSHDGTARVWDAHTGGLLWIVNHHGNPVWSVELAPDGSQFLVAAGKRAMAWNLAYDRRSLAELIAFTACHVSYIWKNGRLEKKPIDRKRCASR